MWTSLGAIILPAAMSNRHLKSLSELFFLFPQKLARPVTTRVGADGESILQLHKSLGPGCLVLTSCAQPVRSSGAFPISTYSQSPQPGPATILSLLDDGKGLPSGFSDSNSPPAACSQQGKQGAL